MKILYAEDDPTMTILAQITLERAGHNVRHCPDSGEVIALMQAGTYAPDLILTDFHMPVMNADAMVAALREIEFSRAIPIIVMSGSLMEETALASMDIVGTIDKMGDVSKLPDEIKRIMNEAGRAWS